MPSFAATISILPILSKVIEKVFMQRIIAFLHQNNTISPCQYGFLRNRSTILACINYYEYIAEALHKNKSIISLSLDLSKAFDSLSHTILLKKLHHYGIRGTPLNWLKSYLTNRYQCVTLDGGKYRSNFELIRNGVPQGSVLGPLLFLIYCSSVGLVRV